MRTFATLFIIALTPTAMPAQTGNDSSGRPKQVRVRLELGLAIARMSSGGASASSVGPVVGGQVAVVSSRSSDVTLEVLAQPFRVQNPNRDEAYRAVYGMFGWQKGGAGPGRTYFRPSLGLVYRPWSGTDVWVSSETSVALGLAVGREDARSSGIPLVTEAFVLISGADELATMLIGATLGVPSARRCTTR